MTKHCQLCNAKGGLFYENRRADTGEIITTCREHRFDPRAVYPLPRCEPSPQSRVPVRIANADCKRIPISEFKLRSTPIRRSKLSGVVPS
jgi:hypothetical protein